MFSTLPAFTEADTDLLNANILIKDMGKSICAKSKEYNMIFQDFRFQRDAKTALLKRHNELEPQLQSFLVRPSKRRARTDGFVDF